ncbi:putative catalyzes the 6-electron oxidation of protoporphyrinogen-IX to form protoporphyrin-IX [Lyophyllum shimeji]|uniref:Protoporphyrinogen oxidase n=1 Tax=Lyophyllum shimeji TaxID=47721 RepID=A0A9P3PX86_LYOSH|nr:putative catalyzes the 6-electron oxidation of protoporphyrinogen-IX to form protoporphyrin-IX [Lyophyllum shimeji]
MPPPRHIAILGGGLTGLSSAFHLSRRFPNARITLLEKQNRLGGWVRSEQIRLGSDGDPNSNPAALTVEAGPRTLRPASKSVLELINLLHLQSALLTTPRTAPAARSRFLYAPSLQRGLTALPASALAFLGSPLRQVLLPAILREPLRKSNRPRQPPKADLDEDESLASFLGRRFGPDVARLLGSALCHGVYAADARELSVRAAFPALYGLEDRGGGSVVLGVLKDMVSFGKGKGKGEGVDEYDLGDVEAKMRGVAVYSFRGGMQTLSDALVKALEAWPNVELCAGEAASGIEMREDENDSLVVHTAARALEPTHIVSALPLPVLQSILPPPTSHARPLPHLTANPASSVTVLSLVFAVPPHTIHPPGFGYLVPRPPEGYTPSPSPPAAELGVLGTVFDSCALPAQSQAEAEHTKLTVMLGGPFRVPLPSDDEELVTRVLAHLKEALQGDVPRPVAWRVWRHERCIPTLKVGHVRRMEELRAVLMEGAESGEGGTGNEKGEGWRRGAWRGRMEVVGAGVGGVSVGDCVEAGRRLGARW